MPMGVAICEFSTQKLIFFFTEFCVEKSVTGAESFLSYDVHNRRRGRAVNNGSFSGY